MRIPPDDCAEKKLDLSMWKSKFKFQDTLVLDIDPIWGNKMMFQASSNTLQEMDHCFYEALFKDFYYQMMVEDQANENAEPIPKEVYNTTWESYKEPLFCYSISEWKPNNYLIVFLTYGRYYPILSLISCDKSGAYKSGATVRRQFVDAHQVDIFKSELRENKILVSYITQYDTHEKGYGESIIDSTVTSWLISPAGELKKGGANNFKRRLKW